jgi:hypothetical protein
MTEWKVQHVSSINKLGNIVHSETNFWMNEEI